MCAKLWGLVRMDHGSSTNRCTPTDSEKFTLDFKQHGFGASPLFKSNQITFIVTSPQHKCLGEWNSYERAPDSAEKQQTIYIWTDSAKKTTNNLPMDRQCKKTTNNLPMDRQCKKTTNNLPMDRQCKKTTNNLHMDRQCKKTALEHLQCSRQCKKNNNNLHVDRQCNKQQQFTWVSSFRL